MIRKVSFAIAFQRMFIARQNQISRENRVHELSKLLSLFRLEMNIGFRMNFKLKHKKEYVGVKNVFKAVEKMDEKEAIYALKNIKKILEEEEVEFWLDCGTLLGAVRDGKFIPWDMDIDLGAYRTEYEKVKKAMKKIPEDQDTKCDRRSAKIYYTNFDIEITLYGIDGKYAIRHYKKVDHPYFIGVLESIAKLIENNNKRNVIRASKNIPIPITAFFADTMSKLPLKIKEKLIIVCRNIHDKFSTESRVEVKIPKKYFKKLSKITFYGMEFNAPCPIENYLEYRYGEDWKTPKKDYVYYEDDQAIIDDEDLDKVK